MDILTQHRIETGWPELAGLCPQAVESLKYQARGHFEAVEDAKDEASSEGYAEAENEYKPQLADLEIEIETLRAELHAATERADTLQATLDAASDGDVAAMWAAKRSALWIECVQALNAAAGVVRAERKASSRGATMLQLRNRVDRAFIASLNEDPAKS